MGTEPTPAPSPADPVTLADALRRECPRRLLGCLHAAGEYRHYRTAGGKVLCISRLTHHTSEHPPTAAQAALDAAQQPLE